MHSPAHWIRNFIHRWAEARGLMRHLFLRKICRNADVAALVTPVYGEPDGGCGENFRA